MPRIGKTRATAVAVAILLAPALPAYAQSTVSQPVSTSAGRLFTGVTFFGDSITDTGNIPRLSGNLDETPPPFYFQGRFSNGPIWADVLPGLLGVSGTSVRNFAIGGATFGDTTISAVLGDNPAIANAGVSSQVRSFIAGGGTFQANDLVHLNAGNNDFGAVLLTRSPEDWPTAMREAADDAATSLGDSIRALQGAGARQFLIQTTLSVRGIPNFAQPEIVAADAPYIARLNGNIVNVINARRRDGDIFYVLDTKTLFEDVLVNPAKYGLTDITTPCLDEATGQICTNVATRLWWDGQHPTERVHGVLAAAAADTLIAPRTLSAQGETSLASTRAFHDRLQDAASADNDRRTAVWFDIGQNGSERPTEPFAIGYEARETVYDLGLSRMFGDVRLGAAVQAFDGDVTLEGRVDGRSLGGFDRHGSRFGAFAATEAGPVRIQLAASTGVDRLEDIERVTGVAGQIARGETTIRTTGARFTLSWPIEVTDTLELAPTASVLYERARIDGYREDGAVGLNQIVNATTQERLEYEVGGRMIWRQGRFTADATATWVFADADQSPLSSALVTVPGVVRTLPGATRDQDYGRLANTLSFAITSDVSIQASTTLAIDDDDREEWAGGFRLVYRR